MARPERSTPIVLPCNTAPAESNRQTPSRCSPRTELPQRNVLLRSETCPFRKAGPTRKVLGTKAVSYTEEDWLDEDANAPSGPDD